MTIATQPPSRKSGKIGPRSETWPRVPLGELMRRTKEFATIEPTKVYQEVTVRLWGRGVIQRRSVIGGEVGGTRFLARTNQFIVSRIDARNGASGLVPPELDEAIVTNDFPLFELEKDRLLPGYIHWLSKTRAFVDDCIRASEGTTNRVRLKEDRFLNLEIAIPPIDEQRRIVDRIDTIANKVTQVRELCEQADTELDAMLRSRFSQIIQGAKRAPMNEVAPIVRRKVEIVDGEQYGELGIRCFGKGTFHKPALSSFDVGTKKLYRIEAGDLVFSNVFAWEGAIAVALPQDDGRFGSHRFITCVPDRSLASSVFLWFYFQTGEGREQIQAASPGGAGRNRTLGLKKLEQIQVPVPGLSDQRRFEKLYSWVENIREHRTKTTQHADALLPSILDRAFKGEL